MSETHYQRANKDDVYLKIAEELSTLSHDSQRQHGCVLVKNGRIIATGFNGFPPGGDDKNWPNTRPEKYPYMVHAEENAILSCASNGVDCSGATAYITGRPCLKCARMLISCKIFNWKIGDRTHQDCKQEEEVLNKWIQHYNIQITSLVKELT